MLKSEKSTAPNDGVLFEKPSSGAEVLGSLSRARLFKRLFSLSRKHIDSGQRQLVVFSFDFIAHHINIEGIYERGELDTFFLWMSQQRHVFDGIAVDVGANIGNHSLYFSDYYTKVHSFEPNPRTFQVLKLNAALVTNVFCHDFGISDVEASANLNVYAGNIGHSDLSATAGAMTVGVQLKTLDASIDSREIVRLIKFDVEGHEYQAIRGSQKTIRRHMPVILFEQLSTEIENGTSKVIELLRTSGYQSFASVRKSTTLLRSKNGATNRLLTLLNKLPIAKSVLFGTTWSIRVQQKFDKADYRFIVALPEWLITRSSPPASSA